MWSRMRALTALATLLVFAAMWRPAPAQPPPGGVTIPILPTDPTLGPKQAKVTMIEFSDFQCPFCRRAAATVAELHRLYPRDLRIVFKQLPLPFHAHSELAAEASLAANVQGKFWPMHDELFAHQDDLSRAAIERYAARIGLDLPRFRRALDNHTYRPTVAADVQQALAAGINATPTFIINGLVIPGAQPLPVFRQVIEEALQARARTRAR